MQELIERELAFSCNVIRDGHEVVPRFLIKTPDGEATIFCPLPDDVNVRFARMNLVSRFMAYKLATGFVLSTELVEPDCVSAIGVVREGAIAGVKMIERKPLKFGPTEWLSGEQVGDEIPSLFPKVHEELSSGDVHDIETAIKEFSPDTFAKVGQ